MGWSSVTRRKALFAEMKARHSVPSRHWRYRVLFLLGFATHELTDRKAAFTVFANLKTAAMSGSSTTAIISVGISAAKRFGFAFE
jgi:hypothetical protein